MIDRRPTVAVVIPCYRVRRHILDVVGRIGPDVNEIYVVDDACPEGSGDLVQEQVKDPRVRVFRHATNLGVGGATMTGFREALARGVDIVVKLDGDGQMDPGLLPTVIKPLVNGMADYAKGNRFFDPDDVAAMPAMRLIGNAALSFLSKISTGYWNLFDPTNGYVAINAGVLRLLPLDKLNKRYFFESDMLFRLALLRAVVVDVPMRARYGDESSSLRVGRTVLPFLFNHTRNFAKRFFYNYLLRDFSVASVETLLGVVLMIFGVVYGSIQWAESVESGRVASSGTVMLAALPIIVGVQLLLSALNYDIRSVPRIPRASFIISADSAE